MEKGISGYIVLKISCKVSIDSLNFLSSLFTIISEPDSQARGIMVAIMGTLSMLVSAYISESYSMNSSRVLKNLFKLLLVTLDFSVLSSKTGSSINISLNLALTSVLRAR